MAEKGSSYSWIEPTWGSVVPRTPLLRGASKEEWEQWYLDNSDLQLAFLWKQAARQDAEKTAMYYGAKSKAKAQPKAGNSNLPH